MSEPAVKRVLAQSVRAVLGRRGMVRLGRFLSDWGRLDVSGPGEFMVQEMVMRHAPASGAVVFDIGANVGDWTVPLLDRCVDRGLRDVNVHAFEPCTGTRELLERRLASHRLRDRVTIVPVAISDRCGTSELFVVGVGAGTNSLHVGGPSAGPQSHTFTETVPTVTVAEYCRRSGIDSVLLIKIDTEGHDMAVLGGATELLRSRRVAVVQFEYNHRWVHSRHYLKDAFDLALPLGYHVGKVTPSAIEFYDRWHFELETFRESNFVLVRDDARPWFDAIRWWNDRP